MAQLPHGAVVYAIGDIHGRLDLLTAMADWIKQKTLSDGSRTEVVLLGDYVDRGPDSAGVLEWLTRADDRPFILHPLLGNHESFLLQALATGQCSPAWLRHGGLDTLQSYGVDLQDASSNLDFSRAAADRLKAVFPPSHRDRLERLPLYIRRGDYLFVHAGVRRRRALTAQEPQDLLWRRPQRGDEHPYFGLTIVHGHTPTSMPAVSKGSVNVDTGAYATSRLSCVRLEASHQSFFSAVRRSKEIVVEEVQAMDYWDRRTRMSPSAV